MPDKPGDQSPGYVLGRITAIEIETIYPVQEKSYSQNILAI
jgi:hypothetical protein